MKGMFVFHISEAKLRAKSDDFFDWKRENEGKDVVAYFYERSKLGEKRRMLNFFHGPVISASLNRLTELGHYDLNKEVMKDWFKRRFLSSSYTDFNGDEQIFVPSLGRLTKDELKTFLDRVLHFMQEDLEADVPDPEEYKIYLRTGKNFRDAKDPDQ